MPLQCPKCGKRVASRAALPGHFRRAHSGLVSSRSASPGRVKTNPLDVAVPIQSEIARPGPKSVSARPIRAEIVNPSPVISARPIRAEIVNAEPVQTALAQREERERWRAGIRGGSLVRREASTLFVSRQDGEARLRAQYHYLQFLAAKLDGGFGTAEDERTFWGALAAYKAHGSRLQFGGDPSKMFPY